MQYLQTNVLEIHSVIFLLYTLGTKVFWSDDLKRWIYENRKLVPSTTFENQCIIMLTFHICLIIFEHGCSNFKECMYCLISFSSYNNANIIFIFCFYHYIVELPGQCNVAVFCSQVKPL